MALEHDIFGDIEWLDADLFSYIEGKMSSIGRYYHTMKHLEDMIDMTRRLNLELSLPSNSWNDLTAAIMFHDIVYDPTKSDNEEKSALIADCMLPTKYNIDRSWVVNAILSSKHHKKSKDWLTNIFLDLDMNIFSSISTEYHLYAKNIRKEYSHVSLGDYVNGRVQFLENVLTTAENMRLFHSVEMFDISAHTKAIRNITQEIENLNNHPHEYLGEH